MQEIEDNIQSQCNWSDLFSLDVCLQCYRDGVINGNSKVCIQTSKDGGTQCRHDVAICPAAECLSADSKLGQIMPPVSKNDLHYSLRLIWHLFVNMMSDFCGGF